MGVGWYECERLSRLCGIEHVHVTLINAFLAAHNPEERVLLDEVWLERGQWNMFSIVREPVDRFLSGFLDKCIRQVTINHWLAQAENAMGSSPESV